MCKNLLDSPGPKLRCTAAVVVVKSVSTCDTACGAKLQPVLLPALGCGYAQHMLAHCLRGHQKGYFERATDVSRQHKGHSAHTQLERRTNM